MTGLLDRLRAWLGGGSNDEADDAEAATDESNSRVVHRDDRPLETPQQIESPDPPVPSAEETTPANRPDTETEAPPTSGSVSIPDAESMARDEPAAGAGASDDSGEDESTADDAEPAAETAEATPSESTDSAPSDDTGDNAGDEDAAFACSVCGTAVDDPESPCPLCRSTDVVPRGDAPTGDGGASQEGRTAVSAADDEAVDRLRDVQPGDEE
ncbi:hypothetical protein SAMN04488065_0590 [Haloplanus vescus]|uniref:Uncharacterized protein n=1 Tax=Haloplanus vescus TaxID=555874 RepID=A0A1H3W7P0_9EURY|nr:hypothetical protein [Haloplanus vescus]SDZ82434.1 hypothetical protein SAMN04488065_0590 [Haloplanus vescus]